MQTIKCVAVGDYVAGLRSLLTTYTIASGARPGDFIPAAFLPTLNTHTVTVDGEPVNLRLLDTEGLLVTCQCLFACQLSYAVA
jgi:hypothetical protein